MAAAHLLRYRTDEAKAVLEEAAKGQGLIPFGAQQALKRWEEGTWALDPEQAKHSQFLPDALARLENLRAAPSSASVSSG